MPADPETPEAHCESAGAQPESPPRGSEAAEARTEVAFLAMGCFWGAEAAFSGLAGVRGTCVGYLGPDKVEVVRVEYDPGAVSEAALAEHWARSHDVRRTWAKRKYASAVYAPKGSRLHKEALRVAPAASSVRLLPADGSLHFALAEERHQQYVRKQLKKARQRPACADASACALVK